MKNSILINNFFIASNLLKFLTSILLVSQLDNDIFIHFYGFNAILLILFITIIMVNFKYHEEQILEKKI